MSDNPYQAPSPVEPVDRRTRVERRGEQSFDSWWDTFFWTFMGFAGGTLLMAPAMMAPALRDRMLGGMIYGGIPLALLVFIVVERRRRARTVAPSQDSCLSEAGKTRD